MHVGVSPCVCDTVLGGVHVVTTWGVQGLICCGVFVYVGGLCV